MRCEMSAAAAAALEVAPLLSAVAANSDSALRNCLLYRIEMGKSVRRLTSACRQEAGRSRWLRADIGRQARARDLPGR